MAPSLAELRWHTGEPFFWTRFPNLIRHCSPSCCSSCRTANSVESALRKIRRSKFGSCAPPIGTLETEIENGSFRQDLFYRINVVNLQMPPLRERRGDIEDLVHYFLEYYNRKYNCRARPISAELLTALQKYHWPGNIRELENLIKRYVILGNEEGISSELVARPPEYPSLEINFDGPISLKKITRQATRELERKVILKVLQANHWNRKRSARALSISYPSAALQDKRGWVTAEPLVPSSLGTCGGRGRP